MQAQQQTELARQAEAAAKAAEEQRAKAQAEAAEAVARAEKEAASTLQEARAAAAKIAQEQEQQAKQAAEVTKQQVCFCFPECDVILEHRQVLVYCFVYAYHVQSTAGLELSASCVFVPASCY